MMSTRDAIECGRQRGCTKLILIGNERHWCDAAIQKSCGYYFVHVSMITEDNMDAEIYSVYFIRVFGSVDDAISAVETECPVRFHELGPLPGQLLFRPGTLEELDESETFPA